MNMKKVVFSLMAVAVFLTTACKKDDTNVSVTDVELNRETLGLVLGLQGQNTETLVVKVLPENATNQKVTWSVTPVDGVTAVSVDNGLVTALRLGKSKVTVTTEEGNFQAHCDVEVTENIVDVTSVTIEVVGGGEFEVEEGAELKLKAVVLPPNATRPLVTWGASNTNASVVVTPGGVETTVTGVTRGEVKISVVVSTAGPGSDARAEVDVTVVPPGVMNQVATADIWYLHAKLTWKSGFTVDSLAVVGVGNDNDFERGIKLSEEALAARALVFGGLDPDKNYRATIFNNNVAYNTVSFATPIIEQGEISVPNDAAGTDLRRLINNFAQDGQILNFEGGGEFSIGSLSFTNGSITLKGGTGRTKINIDGQCGVDYPGKIETIHFENIDFVRAPTGNQDFFNINGSSDASDGAYCVLGKLTWKNCTFRGYTRTPFIRMNTTRDPIPPQSIDELTIEDCIVYTVSNRLINGSSGDLTAAEGNPLKKLVIKNSTFANGTRVLAWGDYKGEIDVTVESCTFYDFGEGTNFLFDLNNGKATVNFTKCIFAKTKLETFRGIRTGEGSTVTSTGCYRTNDFVLASAPIPDLAIYEGTAVDLFVNPAEFNFSIKDAAFAGKGNSGDPRWN